MRTSGQQAQRTGRHLSRLGSREGAHKRGCLVTPPAPDLDGQHNQAAALRAEQLLVSRLFAAACKGKGAALNTTTPAARLPRAGQGRYQRDVHGELLPAPQRQAVGNNLKPPVVARALPLARRCRKVSVSFFRAFQPRGRRAPELPVGAPALVVCCLPQGEARYASKGPLSSTAPLAAVRGSGQPHHTTSTSWKTRANGSSGTSVGLPAKPPSMLAQWTLWPRWQTEKGGRLRRRRRRTVAPAFWPQSCLPRPSPAHGRQAFAMPPGHKQGCHDRVWYLAVTSCCAAWYSSCLAHWCSAAAPRRARCKLPTNISNDNCVGDSGSVVSTFAGMGVCWTCGRLSG